jgi:hypothetical protein
MQLRTFLLIASASLAIAAAVEPAAERALDVEIPAQLNERACKTGCKCQSGIKAGLYCGNCMVNDWYAVIEKLYYSHVFQCGSNGSCCDYGAASDCGHGHPEARCASGKANPG